MSMSSHVTDLLPAYALDCLDDEDLILASEHMVVCEQCRAELQSFQAVVDQLAFIAPEATPSDGLKERIMSSLQPEKEFMPAPKRRNRVPWWQGLGMMVRRTAPAWGLVCFLFAVGLGLGSWNFWQQLHPQPTGDMAEHDHMGEMFEVVNLGCTPQAPDAAGELMISKDGQFALLVVVGLPAPKPGQMYQLWVVRDGQPESSGMFTVTPNGYGSMTISIPHTLAGHSQFDVTIEPAHGSPSPTGPKVLETRI